MNDPQDPNFFVMEPVRFEEPEPCLKAKHCRKCGERHSHSNFSRRCSVNNRNHSTLSSSSSSTSSSSSSSTSSSSGDALSEILRVRRRRRRIRTASYQNIESIVRGRECRLNRMPRVCRSTVPPSLPTHVASRRLFHLLKDLEEFVCSYAFCCSKSRITTKLRQAVWAWLVAFRPHVTSSTLIITRYNQMGHMLARLHSKVLPFFKHRKGTHRVDLFWEARDLLFALYNHYRRSNFRTHVPSNNYPVAFVECSTSGALCSSSRSHRRAVHRTAVEDKSLFGEGVSQIIDCPTGIPLVGPYGLCEIWLPVAWFYRS